MNEQLERIKKASEAGSTGTRIATPHLDSDGNRVFREVPEDLVGTCGVFARDVVAVGSGIEDPIVKVLVYGARAALSGIPDHVQLEVFQRADHLRHMVSKASKA